MIRLTDKRLLIIALVGIAIVTVIGVLTAAPPPAPTLSVRNAEADGAMALSLWLEQSGFRTRQVLSNPIQLNEVDVLFILNPLIAYEADEAAYIREWVAEGHTLIVAGGFPFIVNSLLTAFDLSVQYLPASPQTLTPALPTLNRPPVESVTTGSVFSIQTDRDDVVVHMMNGDEPALVSYREGRGTVWVAGFSSPFTNQGLREDNSAPLILNMLSFVPVESVIGFDEARHGFQEASASLSGWFVSSPAGWGILIAVALTLVYLALYGRRFGRAVPIPQERLRREPDEYIQAMANLFRRSRQRDYILHHYNGQLRRRLSERYGVDPRLSHVDLAKTIAARDSSVDEIALNTLLGNLTRDKVSEQVLLETIIDVDTLLRKIS